MDIRKLRLQPNYRQIEGGTMYGYMITTSCSKDSVFLLLSDNNFNFLDRQVGENRKNKNQTASSEAV